MQPIEQHFEGDDEIAAEASTLPELAQAALSNRCVAFVGKLGGMNRRQARQLVRQSGGQMVESIDDRVDLVVVGADQLPSDNFGELLSDAVLNAASHGGLEIISETELWQRMGMVEAESDARRLYTPAMLSDLLNVPISTIRRWQRRGLIVPVRQVNKLSYYDFEEVASARNLAQLISAGESPAVIEAKLLRLAELFPSLRRPLSQLSIIVEGRDVLLRQGEGLIEPGGQLRIDFAALESLPQPDRVRFSTIDVDACLTVPTLRPFEASMSGDEFLAAAIALEDEGKMDEAAEVYRSMMLALGSTSDVCFRLAELLYQQGDLGAARERYYSAIELDEDFVEARASLGCVLVESGQLGLAEAAFHGALDFHPDYPDVHFHLARLLDGQRRTDEARIHWDHFLRLAPKSPWADEARSRLDPNDHSKSLTVDGNIIHAIKADRQ